MSQQDDKFIGGCLGAVLGFFIVGLMGLAAGLIFLSMAQAFGVGILAALLGAFLVGALGYRAG